MIRVSIFAKNKSSLNGAQVRKSSRSHKTPPTWICTRLRYNREWDLQCLVQGYYSLRAVRACRKRGGGFSAQTTNARRLVKQLPSRNAIAAFCVWGSSQAKYERMLILNMYLAYVTGGVRLLCNKNDCHRCAQPALPRLPLLCGKQNKGTCLDASGQDQVALLVNREPQFQYCLRMPRNSTSTAEVLVAKIHDGQNQEQNSWKMFENHRKLLENQNENRNLCTRLALLAVHGK